MNTNSNGNEQETPGEKTAPQEVMAEPEGNSGSAAEPAGKTRLVWDESDMRLSYANVVNVTAAPGEINIFFGANRTAAPGGREMRVKLSDRLVMTPFTAKRLMAMLAATLKDAEARQTAANAQPRGAASEPAPTPDEASTA